jgi:hypothetical protein
MKALIEDAQKHTNDSTNIQLDPLSDDNNINSSREVESAPDEDVKVNATSNNKELGSVSPIHVPEKPTSGNRTSIKKNALTSHSSSVEKPNPAPLNPKIVKASNNVKSAEKNKKIPKAIMPPKTDY